MIVPCIFYLSFVQICRKTGDNVTSVFRGEGLDLGDCSEGLGQHCSGFHLFSKKVCSFITCVKKIHLEGVAALVFAWCAAQPCFRPGIHDMQ